MRHLLPILTLFLLACDTGGDDSFTYWLNRYGVAGGCLGSYLGGLLVSLTPCVYPMIAITVSVFGANPAMNRRRAMVLSLSFVLGISAMYTPLGLVAGLTGELFGAALASPWVLGGVIVVLVALATPMFGLWELTLPSSLQTKLSTVGGVGFLGAFLMGLVAGILAAPCAGPVTIALLTFVGTSQDPLQGALFFFFYSLGIGTLFFLVGTFAMSLPRGGRWMESVKTVFGVIILVAASYYVTIVYPDVLEIVTAVQGFVGVIIGLVLVVVAFFIVRVASEKAMGWKLKVSQAVAVLVAASGALIGYASYSVEEELIPWRDDYAVADEEARSANRPMVIDFTADWCGACKRLASETFNDPRVAAEAERFTPIRADSTQQDEPITTYMERYDVRGLPTVVVVEPNGEESSRITEFVPPERMLQLLQAAR